MKKTNKKVNNDGGFKNLLNPLDKPKEVWYNKYIKDRKRLIKMTAMHACLGLFLCIAIWVCVNDDKFYK